MRTALAAALLLVWGALGPAAEAAGTIEGKLTCRGVRNCAGAVVYIEQLPGRAFPLTRDAVMDQLNLTFVPHVLPVLVGTKVAFPNSDEVRHNVFSPSAAKRFNLGTYPKGQTKYVVFDKAGVVELLCNVHTEMSAYILVTETPYVVLVQADGSYAIRNAPPGTYVVAAWRSETEVQRREVRLSEGEFLTLNFELRR